MDSASSAHAKRIGLRVVAQPFEAEQLGAPAARILLPAAAGLSRAGLDAALAECTDAWRRAGIALVSCRVAEDDVEAAAALERAGFREIERLVTLTRPVDPCEGDSSAVEPQPGDRIDCERIARSAFRFDRFHADPRIPSDAADAIKAAWVRNGLSGRADAARVVRENDRVCGFVLCLLRGEQAVIDLIGVAPEAQGRGHGRALVAGALRACSGRARHMRVSTQQANRPSLALYAGMGFEPEAVQRTLHWLDSAALP